MYVCKCAYGSVCVFVCKSMFTLLCDLRLILLVTQWQDVREEGAREKPSGMLAMSVCDCTHTHRRQLAHTRTRKHTRDCTLCSCRATERVGSINSTGWVTPIRDESALLSVLESRIKQHLPTEVTHTHTHLYAHSLSLSLSHTHTHTHAHLYTHSLTHTHTRTHTCTHTLTLTYTHTLSLTHTHTHTHKESQ